LQDILRRFAWRIGRHIYCRARGEPRTDDILTNGEAFVQRTLIASNENVDHFCAIDIGANQGDWTLPLLDVLPAELASKEKTCIHAFEPVALTRQRLSAAVASRARGGLVKVHALALSDRSGRAKMGIVSSTGGRNSLVTTELEPSDVIEVETMTLAEFFSQHRIDRVQLVKVDAEGHDLAILKGAHQLLAAERIDVVQFEYNHAWVFSRAFLKDVFELVAGLPYAVARSRQHGIEVLDEWHPELERFFHCNYLLVRKPALAWFPAKHGRFDSSNTYA
jgi:FkbM family methyltransferase